MAYDFGPTTPYQSLNAGVIPNSVYGIAINWFANRTPLASRLPKVPVGSPTFLITNDNFRPRSTTLNQGGTLSNSGTSVTVTDGSFFLPGDKIQIESEALEIQSISGNTLTVGTRGNFGSAAATHVDASIVYLIGNTRTGAEVNQTGISRRPAPVTQYCQTVQHPWNVGGALQSSTNYVSGYGLPLQRDKFMSMQHVMDDIETSCYYGFGLVDGSDTTRPAMKGLRNLIVTNSKTAPTNSGAYKPSDLIRDALESARTGGGEPDLLVVSTNFMSGMATWGHAVQRLEAGANVYGTPIDLFEAPFLNGVSIIEAPLLRPFSCIALTSSEVRMRIKRQMYEKPRGSRGDADEGDMIWEGAIELDNEAHHAWVEGITAFSAT